MTSTLRGARSRGLTYCRGTIPESGKTSPSERLEKLASPDCYASLHQESGGLGRSQTEDTNGGRGLGDQLCCFVVQTELQRSQGRDFESSFMQDVLQHLEAGTIPYTFSGTWWKLSLSGLANLSHLFTCELFNVGISSVECSGDSG